MNRQRSKMLGLVGVLFFSSCMVEYVKGPRGPMSMSKFNMKVYDRTKQMFLFGAINLSKRNYPQIPDHPYWQLRIKYNFGDAMINLFTFGILKSRTFVVYVPLDTSYVAYEYGFAPKPRKGFSILKKSNNQNVTNNVNNASNVGNIGGATINPVTQQNPNILSPLAMRLKMLVSQEMARNTEGAYTPSQQIMQEYPISNMNGTYMVDLIIDVSDSEGAETIIFQLGGFIKTKAGSIWTVTMPLDKFVQIEQYHNVFKYIDIAQKVNR